MVDAVSQLIYVFNKDDVLVASFELAAYLDLVIVYVLAELVAPRDNDRHLSDLDDLVIAAGTAVGDDYAGICDELIHLALLIEFLPFAVLGFDRGISRLDDDFLIVIRSPLVHTGHQPVELLLMCSYGNDYHAQKMLPRYTALG